MCRGEQAQRMGAAIGPQETQGTPELSWGHWGTQSNARIQEGLREVKLSQVSIKVPVRMNRGMKA